MGQQNEQLLSKIATGNGHCENSSYFDGWKAYDRNPFHPIRNPGGVIQMGLAENLLCLDLIKEWIGKHPQASICTEKGLEDFESIVNFQDYHGLPSFRQGLAKFMAKARGGKVHFDPDRIVMSGGGTGAQETLAFCLADPGDAFLVPTPYYPGFDRDFCWRTGVKLMPIDCYSYNNFEITKNSLEIAYQNAIKENIKIKGILMTNPSNPLGTTTDRETLKMILKFINQKRIHLICDEIFAGSVFDQTEFTSVCELINEDQTYDKNLVHVAYSLSKDLGMPGFRVGVIYSFNDLVVNCARRMSSFGLISSETQHLISHMLNDDDFTSKYLTENKERLRKRHSSFISGLKKLEIICLESTAGLFVWMDLRRFLKERTINEELKLWQVIINEVKLNVSPGSSFHCTEPGWFRVCFANMDVETMRVALERIRGFVGKVKEEIGLERKEKKKFDRLLRLSLPRGRKFDDGIATSCLISPHSPLVKATN